MRIAVEEVVQSCSQWFTDDTDKLVEKCVTQATLLMETYIMSKYKGTVYYHDELYNAKQIGTISKDAMEYWAESYCDDRLLSPELAVVEWFIRGASLCAMFVYSLSWKRIVPKQRGALFP